MKNLTLEDYLKRKGLSHREFCNRVGMNLGYFRHILKGRRRPSPQLAEKISDATNGSVTVLTLLFPKN